MSRPNPGSDAAIEKGCVCPVLDNNHGKYPPYRATDVHPEGWWIQVGCPVHGSSLAVEETPGEGGTL